MTMRYTAVWEEHPGPLPTMSSKTAGIIAMGDGLCTIQCSVCHRTVTDLTIFAVKSIDFSPDAGQTGRLKYRRCPICRAAQRHPSNLTVKSWVTSWRGDQS